MKESDVYKIEDGFPETIYIESTDYEGTSGRSGWNAIVTNADGAILDKFYHLYLWETKHWARGFLKGLEYNEPDGDKDID